MSDLEQRFVRFLVEHPEITKAQQLGIVNRRGLARLLVDKEVVDKDEFSAALGMLRRFSFQERSGGKEISLISYGVKSNMAIFSFKKSNDVLNDVQASIQQTDLAQGEGIKVVTGTQSVTIILQASRTKLLEELRSQRTVLSKKDGLAEVSLQFSEDPSSTSGILGAVTQSLNIHDIVIHECLTSTEELLLFIDSSQIKEIGRILESWDD